MLHSAFRLKTCVALVVFCALASGIVMPASAQEAVPQDEAEAMVRINRLENMMRQMQGQIEELQFANQKLQEQLQFMAPASESRASTPGQGANANLPPVIAAPPPQQGPKSVEIPQTPQQPQAQANSGPINLLAAGKAPQAPTPSGPGTPPMTLEQQAAAVAAGQMPQSAPPVAPAPAPVEQKSNFEIAKDAMAAKDYEKAVNVLTGIVEGNPKEPKIADALMMLGDAQYRLKRYPEAAQRYLKLAQTYPKHPDAATAFVRLGMSLNEMGQKPQACATFAEFSKRYPSAKGSVKAEADRGKKAASCG